ncbi:chitin elicitor receptor kinase [Ancistrocladus abbreviatus]
MRQKGVSGRVSICIFDAAVAVLVVRSLYAVLNRIKKQQGKFSRFWWMQTKNNPNNKAATNPKDDNKSQGSVSTSTKTSNTVSPDGSASSRFTNVTIERSLEFSHKQLPQATNNFSMSNKIREGGFGCVYYAELRGKKTAIKKMKKRATTVFLAELKILTNVNHMNLNGFVSAKIDVYAFGVVLFKLISARTPIVKEVGLTTEFKKLATLFEDALSKQEPTENLHSLVDPALGDNYSLDSEADFPAGAITASSPLLLAPPHASITSSNVAKVVSPLQMALLVRACTQEDPEQRLSMRAAVVA